MTEQQEKAAELIQRFTAHTVSNLGGEQTFENAKQCAIIAVDLVIHIAEGSGDDDHINWWKEVKKEIEKL